MVELFSMKQHGASMKLHFSLLKINKSIRTKISKEYNIHNFAVVRFRIKQPDINKIYYRYIDIVMRKHGYAKDYSIQLKVKASDDVTIDIKSSEKWSKWFRVTNALQDYLEIELQITVNKIQSAHIKHHEDDTLADTDFQLSAEDGSVSVHRAYLAAHSDVFKTMLGQWKETAEGRLEFKGVTRQTLQHFKDYIYSGTLPDDGLCLCQLLLLTTHYLVHNLELECKMKVMETITPENLDACLEFAVENEMHEFRGNIIEKTPVKIVALAHGIRMKALKRTKDEEELTILILNYNFLFVILILNSFID